MPRSGTTFLGNILAIPRGVAYMQEPFNADHGIARVAHHFYYIDTDHTRASDEKERLVDDFVRGRSKFRKLPPEEAKSSKAKIARATLKSTNNFTYKKARLNPAVSTYIVKDPSACLLSEYLHNKYDFKVVLMVRHPAATAMSFKRLGLHHDIADLTRQKPLMSKYLKSELANVNTSKLSDIEQTALLWKCLNLVLADFATKNPDMILVRHEDISTKPQKNFKTLYNTLDLRYSDDVRAKVAAQTSAKNPIDAPDNKMHHMQRNSAKNAYSWHGKLDKRDVAKIKEITGDVAKKFYGSSTWRGMPDNFVPNFG